MGKIKSGVNLNCLACGKEFYVPSYRKDTAKFCSLDCQNHKQYDKYIFNCLACGKEVIAPPSRRYKTKKFCSLDCRESNAMGVVERRRLSKALSKLKRGSSGNRGLRKHVFCIKEKSCEVCGYNEYDFCLDIHHIDENPTNNEISNIAVLCCICHRKLHKKIISINQEQSK